MIIRKDNNNNNHNRNDNMGNSSQGNTYLALFTRPRSHSILFIQKFVFELLSGKNYFEKSPLKY